MTIVADSETFLPVTLPDLVDPARIASGELRGDREAITDGTTSLTWQQYVDQIARLAGALVDIGVCPGDRVAIRMPKSVASFVAVHAVLRSGAVMVPIDPLAPMAHAVAVLDDSGAKVLVAHARARGLQDIVNSSSIATLVLPTVSDPPTFERLLRVVAQDELASAEPVEAAQVGADEPAYVIYTSGSTGRPKGIVHTHASAMAYASTAAAEYGLTPDDRLANIAPLHFDQSTFELYAAAIAGAAVLVVPDPVMRFPASLSEMISEQRITVWYSVPYLLEQLSTRGALADRDLTALRWVLYGGEAFPPGQLATLMRQLPGATFSNVYGPAEVNQVTVHHLTEPPDGDSVPIGRPWPGATLRIVDPDDPRVEAPAGQPGVLWVSSPTMMSHYWNRPDLTDRAIVFERDTAGTDVRWYVTGDLVVERPDGTLVFLGRVDNQVKLRGHRIELEAVDVVLNDIAGVGEATAVVHRPSDADHELVALVVPADGASDAHADFEKVIIGTLRNRLPRAAVPSSVVLVESLPRTGTGKVDRVASGRLLEPIEREL